MLKTKYDFREIVYIFERNLKVNKKSKYGRR